MIFHPDEGPRCREGDEDHGRIESCTLRDFDESRYRHRRLRQLSDDPRFGGRSYRGALYLDEARIILNRHFVSALLSMAPGYIYFRLCDTSRESLLRLIPHRYVRGKDHGRIEGQHIRWDMRLDAGAQTGVLKEVQRRVWDYEKARLDALLTQWDVMHRSCVYIFEQHRPPGSALHIAFSDKEALREVRLRSLVRDCRVIQRSSQELEEAVRVEGCLLARFVELQYADVLRSEDPKVVRLRERRRIRVAR
jgi:hypothetical protein